MRGGIKTTSKSDLLLPYPAALCAHADSVTERAKPKSPRPVCLYGDDPVGPDPWSL